MQTQTRMDKVVIQDFYQASTMNENVNQMKLTHLLSNLSLNLRAPFYTSTFTSKFLIVCLKSTHLVKITSLSYVYYAC